ncbi:hypothetical protein LJB77_02315 [Ruminococcaceae bacterium OttesenSCG-928-N02]|nr:hypothetical protein [Ruminococcaceae bacterium OttesenSCG-928-N02]
MLYLSKEDPRKCILDGHAASYDCTPAQTLSLAAAFRYCQELSDGHCALLGLDFDALMKMNCVYLLSKMSLTFYKPLTLRQVFKAQTYPRSLERLQHLRDSVFENEAGELAFTCTSAWVMVNPQTHRLLRPKEFPQMPLTLVPEGALGTERFGRITPPQDMPLVGTRPVYYSDIDVNGHLNNCVYAQYIQDYMPAELQNTPIEEVDIHFKREAMQGEEISFFVKQEGDKVYFLGEHARGVCFEAVCKIKQG